MDNNNNNNFFLSDLEGGLEIGQTGNDYITHQIRRHILQQQLQQQQQQQQQQQLPLFQSQQPPPPPMVGTTASGPAMHRHSQPQQRQRRQLPTQTQNTQQLAQRTHDPRHHLFTPLVSNVSRPPPSQQPHQIAPQRAPPTTTATTANVMRNNRQRIADAAIANKFPFRLFRILNENKFPDTLRWSSDGGAFYVDRRSADFAEILRRNFNYKTFNHWMRQLRDHGWKKIAKGKNQGMLFNPHFHRNMGGENFTRIASHKEKLKKERERKGRMHEKIRNEAKLKSKLGRKKTATKTSITTTASKKNKEAPGKTLSTSKNKAKKTTKATSKRKAVSEGVAQSLNKKKRKKSPLSPEPAKERPPSTSDSNDDDKDDEKRLKKKLRDHKKLHNLLWNWDMWNFPKRLDVYLDIGKVQRYTPIKKIPKRNASVSDVDSETHFEKNNKNGGTIADLLCDEEISESLEDGEQALAHFVDRIRKDKLEHDKLKEMWSNVVIPNVNGKALPPAKFAKPNDKWKKAKAGDRISVCWRDDELFYNATIQKQQENTSYFHLVYDDDGAQEWLDLSRETIKLLDGEKKKKPTFRSPPKKTVVADKIPQKDNRSLLQNRETSDAINLPKSHSHLAPFVRYCWKPLDLGTRAGTPSYHSYITEKDPSAPRAAVLEILNDIRDLRSKGFSGIPLKLDSENTNGNDNITASDSSKLFTNQLCSLQDKISKGNDVHSSMEDFRRTLDAVRKLTDTWSTQKVRDSLRTIETQVLKLNEREARILEKCGQKRAVLI